MRTTIGAALVVGLAACNPVTLKPAEDGGTCGRGLRCSGGYTPIVESVAAVDLLVVVDNSGSMAAPQAKLAASFDVLLERLQDSKLDLDLRIAFTTTDQGNPLCPGSDPERGELVLSSCLDRVEAGEFVFDGVDPAVDGSFACTDACSLSDAALTIQPTATYDLEPRPRRWVELAGGTTNLPEGVDLAEALACFAPQGIAGCGFESQLESMFQALHKSDDPESPNARFLRPNAILAIVFLTDEVDCSYNPAHEAVFLSEKALWSDPDAALPSSAMCWRAGVECLGDPAGYEGCASANVGVDAALGVDGDDAVLQPMARYLEMIELLENERREFNTYGAKVLISVIGGVPQDYGGEGLIYSAVGDQDHLDEFGVDPGCVDISGNPALPPVRLRELGDAQRVDDRSDLFSICAPDYGPALSAIGDRIMAEIQPACMPGCVADVDRTTEIVDGVECSLVDVNVLLGEKNELPRCEGEPEAPTPPEGEASCWFPLVDRGGQTPTPADDMSPGCVDDGWNLEFGFVRQEPKPGYIETDVVCVLSDLPELDCPDLQF